MDRAARRREARERAKANGAAAVAKYTYYGWTANRAIVELFAIFSNGEPTAEQVRQFQRQVMAQNKVLQMPKPAFCSVLELEALPEAAEEAQPGAPATALEVVH